MEACFECRGLSKRFGNVQALDEVNISIMPGRVVGLLGPNGSGKTTLIKLANGLLTPDSGEIDVCGYKPGKESKALVSYLPDRPCLPEWMNTRQLMDLYADFYADFDRERAGKMLEHLNIPEKRTIKQMSKGTREKVQLIMVMSRRARVYILDEPIAGVDPAARDYILKTIIQDYSEDASILLSTHLIADVEQLLDDVIFLKDGQIILSSSVEKIRDTRHQSVDSYFREVFSCSQN